MSAKTCNACRRRSAMRYEAAMKRKRGVVVSLVAAALLVLVVGLWASGQTGDAKLGIVGAALAVCVLWFASDAEGS